MPRQRAARADAVRKAHEATAERDTQRRQRDRQIEDALADYYQAAADAERIRAAARRKADSAIAAGEQAAAGPADAIRDAVRRLRELLGGNAEVAQLCGITTAQVREYLAVAAAGQPEGDDDHAQ